MKNIKMCNEEIENYFDEEGHLRIKCKWEKDSKIFVSVLHWTVLTLFWYIPVMGWIFEKISELFELLESGICTIMYKIEKVYFKRKYLKDYVIPSKKEIKEYYKNQNIM